MRAELGPITPITPNYDQLRMRRENQLRWPGQQATTGFGYAFRILDARDLLWPPVLNNALPASKWMPTTQWVLHAFGYCCLLAALWPPVPANGVGHSVFET